MYKACCPEHMTWCLFGFLIEQYNSRPIISHIHYFNQTGMYLCSIHKTIARVAYIHPLKSWMHNTLQTSGHNYTVIFQDKTLHFLLQLAFVFGKLNSILMRVAPFHTWLLQTFMNICKSANKIHVVFVTSIQVMVLDSWVSIHGMNTLMQKFNLFTDNEYPNLTNIHQVQYLCLSLKLMVCWSCWSSHVGRLIVFSFVLQARSLNHWLTWAMKNKDFHRIDNYHRG